MRKAVGSEDKSRGAGGAGVWPQGAGGRAMERRLQLSEGPVVQDGSGSPGARVPPLTGTLPRRYGNSTRSYAVRLGDYHTLVPEEFEEELAVQKIVLHWAYRPDSSDYDIALVRLRGPRGQCARLSSHVLPACLPLWRERPQKTAPHCYITGWGDTGNGRSRGSGSLGHGSLHRGWGTAGYRTGPRPSCSEGLLRVRCMPVIWTHILGAVGFR